MPDLSDSLSLVVGGLQLLQGWAQPFTVPAPAAGQLTTGRVTPGETWERVQLARATFTASAVVGNRIISARIIDYNGNIYWESPVAQAVVASTAVTVNLSTDVTTGNVASGLSVANIPDLIMQSGFSLQLAATGGTDVGDQWSALALYVQRYPTDIVHSGPAG